METHFDELERHGSSRAWQRVVADLRMLSRDAEDLLKATASDMSDKAKETRARVLAALERARTTCDGLQDRTTAAAKSAARQTDTLVREHPYESLGVAFGVGVLIGALIARK